jgi:hypothetical protein
MAGWFRTETETIVKKHKRINKKQVKEDVGKLSLATLVIAGVGAMALLVISGKNG